LRHKIQLREASASTEEHALTKLTRHGTPSDTLDVRATTKLSSLMNKWTRLKPVKSHQPTGELDINQDPLEMVHVSFSVATSESVCGSPGGKLKKNVAGL